MELNAQYMLEAEVFEPEDSGYNSLLIFAEVPE